MKMQALFQALSAGGYDAAFGGARRDEEKSRAKERVYSFRDRYRQWDPKNQRPELWNVYNGKINKGESIRVFPLSNWTELDVWQYVQLEKIPVVPLYYAAEWPVVERDGELIMVDDERIPLGPGEQPRNGSCGSERSAVTLSGAVDPRPRRCPKSSRRCSSHGTSERQGRMIDFDEAGSMETKKREGLFPQWTLPSLSAGAAAEQKLIETVSRPTSSSISRRSCCVWSPLRQRRRRENRR